MLYRLLKPYFKKILFLCLVSLIYSSVNLLSPWIYKIIFDQFVPGYTERLLYTLCGMILLICVSAIATNAFIHILLVDIQAGFAKNLQLKGIDYFLDYPYSYYQQHPFSQVMTLIGADMEKLSEFIWNGLYLATLVIQLITMLIFLFFFLDLKVFILIIISIIFYFGWTQVFQKLSLQYEDASLKMCDKIYKHCADIYLTIKEIKCMGLYESRIHHLTELTRLDNKFSAKVILYKSLISIGASLPMRLTMVGIFIFGYYGIMIGNYTPGYVMINLVYAGTLIYPVSALFNGLSVCLFFSPVIKKIKPFLNKNAESSGSQHIEHPGEGLKICQLNFSYPIRITDKEDLNEIETKPGNDFILNNLNINIPTGILCTIVGKSGAGKSTLLALLVKLLSPPQGSIFINGMDICRIENNSLRKLIGIVTQDPYILNETLRNNIDLDGNLSDPEILDLCRQVTLDNLLKQLPKKLDTLIFERGQNLSGGERQRVILARRLARGNKVMILDEATSALDHETELAIIKTIKWLRDKKGITFINISHRPELARQSDLIYVLEQGKIIEQGCHYELINGKSHYQKIYRTLMQQGVI